MNARWAHIPLMLTCIKPHADLVDRARKVGVDALLVKPFAPSTLLERVGAVVKASTRRYTDYDRQSPSEILRARTFQIGGLGSLPDTAAQIRRLAKIEGAINRDITQEVEMDPHLVDAVIMLANSDKEIYPRRIANLRQGVSQAGFPEIANLVLTIQILWELG